MTFDACGDIPFSLSVLLGIAGFDKDEILFAFNFYSSRI